MKQNLEVYFIINNTSILIREPFFYYFHQLYIPLYMIIMNFLVVDPSSLHLLRDLLSLIYQSAVRKKHFCRVNIPFLLKIDWKYAIHLHTHIQMSIVFYIAWMLKTILKTWSNKGQNKIDSIHQEVHIYFRLIKFGCQIYRLFLFQPRILGDYNQYKLG